MRHFGHFGCWLHGDERHLTNFFSSFSAVWRLTVYFELRDACRLVLGTNTAGFMSPKDAPLTKKRRQEKNDPAERRRQKQAREAVISQNTGSPSPGSLAMKVRNVNSPFFWKLMIGSTKTHIQTVSEYWFQWPPRHHWNWLQPVYLLLSAKIFLFWVNFLDYTQDYIDFHRDSWKA